MKPLRLIRKISFGVVLITCLAFSIFPAHAAAQVRPIPAFMNFITSVKNGQAGLVSGVYVPGLFALKVSQQPANDPSFVAPWLGTVTEFKAAKNSGNIGLLAHNHLAGQDFPSLKTGQEVRIIYGDGKIEYFRVTKILHYRALQPESMVSDFIDLNSGERLTWSAVYKITYQGARHLTFQTCIDKNGNQTWGRLFVIAEPYTP